jgi:hypothetical protein
MCLAGEGISRGKFIRTGAVVLGASAAGTSVIAACGGAEKASEEPLEETVGDVGGATEVTEAGGTAGVAQVESGTAIAQESDVPAGSALEFTDSETNQPAVLWSTSKAASLWRTRRSARTSAARWATATATSPVSLSRFGLRPGKRRSGR